MVKVRLILLAAGNSSRFGSNKLLYSIDEKPMFTYGLKVMEELLLKDYNRELYVVTRFDPIIEAVEEMSDDTRFKDRVHAIYSPESKEGVSYSIKAGLRKVSLREKDGFMKEEEEAYYYVFMVADQPFIKAETVERLIQETIGAGKIGGCVTWEGISGNPVIFSKQLKSELLALEGDKGGKAVLKNYMDEICKIPASSEEELIDKDFLNEVQ